MSDRALSFPAAVDVSPPTPPSSPRRQNKQMNEHIETNTVAFLSSPWLFSYVWRYLWVIYVEAHAHYRMANNNTNGIKIGTVCRL